MSGYILVGAGCFFAGYIMEPYISTITKIFKRAWIEYCKEKYEQSKAKENE